ncbi:MAG: DUF4149 domain-containing protein [Gammaproteobacteria bacterium]|jgi:hypothetical protein|nr:DUF4149 domain-containing protein [Gammaproteobacteria bacterium]MBT7523572.1 DUF4149 domain-containing protein [Gammaproteobacteria bacterium]MBT7814646.1 DUF4149 domain-containing protein [Gammaproteobacteria bacterium]MDC3386544.1 DUF4149 domain-containing protein [Gammaproteobacteria bacterium]MDG2172111.1 DUF4149 domain-containing protein [Gammaproteobacteria bacterium]|tara:strand:+ start:7 stop:402 length:396 start_codon:yes stop_codon:yes gene_type:complete
MELLIKIIPSLVLGSMLFFSIAIAPKIFTVLPNEEAGKFVRSIFPTYYMYNGLQYLLLTILLFYTGQNGNTLYLSCLILFFFILSNYILMPQINKSRDIDNQKKFKLLHFLSVVINFLIIVSSVILILLIN